MKIDETDGFQAQIRTMRIVVGGLAAGALLFGVLALTVLRDAARPHGPAGKEPMILGLPLVTAMAAGFGVITLIASLVAPRAVVESGLRAIAEGVALDETKATESGQRQVYPANDVGRLLPLFQSQLIVASALNEGGAFFALIAYRVEDRPVALAIAGALVAVLLSRFPTEDRVRSWLDAQLERLAALRRDDFSHGA